MERERETEGGWGRETGREKWARERKKRTQIDRDGE